jgi:alanine or glycine:cation symporter, AGCS family
MQLSRFDIPSFFFNLTVDGSIDEKINNFIKPAVDALGEVIFYKPFASAGFDMPLVVMWLILGALFFTVYMGFINLRGVKHAVDLIKGKYDKPGDKGEVSHFQALVTALSGTVGLGNIAGVAVAISIGGPGATFWIIVAGFLGMSSKFVECTLGVKYRKINALGEVSGGPMYYLSEGLNKKGFPKLGKFLAALFAILCVGGSFGGGNMFQANQSFAQLANVFPVFNGFGFVYGIFLALLVGIVIIGGIKKIASVTDKMVPFMVGLYVLTSVYIILMNIQNIGAAFSAIFNGAFTADGISGGVVGVLIVGFKRAAFSNEAGVGSAAIAHSAVKTDHPISEGIVSLLEPFVDTIVVCTMTALVLVFTGFASDTNGMEGSALTSAAFSSVVPWFKYILLITIVLFAFSTMISWSYYGMKAFTFLFGNNRKMENLYKLIFLGFVVIGSSASLGAVIDFSDMMILAMGFPNILGLYFMAGEVKADMKSYFAKVKSGEIARHK